MSGLQVNVQELGVAGHDVSWAGECPWTKSICFGTDAGALAFPPDLMPEASLNAGAINAVAFSGDFVAVSSPVEVTVWERINAGPLQLRKIAHTFDGGAHNIVASGSGIFAATLGDDGLVILAVRADPTTIRVGRYTTKSEYCYKILPFAKQGSSDMLLCAARRNGLLAIPTTNGIPCTQSMRFPLGGHDIIDLCPLEHPDHPNAVACLTRSSEIIIVPNVHSSELPYAVQFPGIEGTGYALACVRDHLFLLTSEAFVTIPNVISRMIEQAPLTPTPTPTIPIEASDMFLIGDQALALLVNGSARILQVAELVGAGSTAFTAAVLGTKTQLAMQIPTRQPAWGQVSLPPSVAIGAFADQSPV